MTIAKPCHAPSSLVVPSAGRGLRDVVKTPLAVDGMALAGTVWNRKTQPQRVQPRMPKLTVYYRCWTALPGAAMSASRKPQFCEIATSSRNSHQRFVETHHVSDQTTVAAWLRNTDQVNREAEVLSTYLPLACGLRESRAFLCLQGGYGTLGCPRRSWPNSRSRKPAIEDLHEQISGPVGMLFPRL